MVKQAQFGPRTFGGLVEEFLNGTNGRFFRDDASSADEWFNSSLKVPVNVQETETTYTIDLAIPGVSKEEVKLNVNDKTLTVSYEQQEEEKKDSGKWLRREFKTRSFKKAFTLGDKVDAEKITAGYNSGILHLELPKKEAAIAVSKMIEIQ